jgi:hypothetical protein
MAERFGLSLGALAPPIQEQLSRRGLQIEPETLERLQQNSDAITRLQICGILTEAESDRARNRFMKKLSEHVRPIEPAAGEVQP